MSWWKNATVGNALDLCESKARTGENVAVSAKWLHRALRRLAKTAGEEWKPLGSEEGVRNVEGSAAK
jgi:hypothetical protein